MRPGVEASMVSVCQDLNFGEEGVVLRVAAIQVRSRSSRAGIEINENLHSRYQEDIHRSRGPLSVGGSVGWFVYVRQSR